MLCLWVREALAEGLPKEGRLQQAEGEEACERPLYNIQDCHVHYGGFAGSKQGMPYSHRGEGFCLRAAQDEVSTERPSIIRKRTYLQCNIPLLRTINSVIKKADFPLFPNVSDTMKVITSSLPSFSIHCQEMSAVPLSPSHCTHKESSASSDADSADSGLSESSIGGGSKCGAVARIS